MRRVAGAAILLVGMMSLTSCYVLNQGASLLRYQVAAEPIEKILANSAFADGSPVSGQTLSFIAEVARIRAFAAEQGLSASRNYTSLVPTEREYLADVVNAAAELSFDRHMWWWPFVGRLPYKGYYDPGDALRLARRLERRGLDVWVRRVDAFSTLGVLRDPLYEFMTGYDRHTLASLIMHEQAHATLFLRGNSQFNEEFASFVGDAGADAYLHAVGAPDEEIALVHDRTADRETARSLVFSLREDLEAVYQSPLTPDRMRTEKAWLIAEWQRNIAENYESWFRTESFRALGDIPVNNAYIDLYVSYTEDLGLFRALYDTLDGDLSVFLEELQVLNNPRRIRDPASRQLARRDPKEYVRTRLLDSAGDL